MRGEAWRFLWVAAFGGCLMTSSGIERLPFLARLEILPFGNDQTICMELSEFAFRVMLLFFPGIICGLIVDALTVHRKRAPFEVSLLAITYGLASYFVYWATIHFAGSWLNNRFHLHMPPDFGFLKALQDDKARLSFVEIAWVCFTSVILGFVLSAASTYKVFHWFARFVKVTRKSGELDVWGYAFNSPSVEFATVRDYRHDLVYDGWIQSFSDDAKASELLLRDVAVYRNSDGTLLYEVGAVYISFQPNEMAIEFRGVPFTPEFQRQIKSQNEQQPTEQSPSAPADRRGDQEGRRQSTTDESASATSSAATTCSGAEKAIADSFRLLSFSLVLVCLARLAGEVMRLWRERD